MMVARSARPAEDRRVSSSSSVTSVPRATSASRPEPGAPSAGSIVHRPISSGRPSRCTASRTVLARSSFPVTTARTFASSMIQDTWLTEEVSYTGTVTAPAYQMAKSTRVHSRRVEARSPTVSPGWIPAAMSPLARARTRSRASRAETSVHWSCASGTAKRPWSGRSVAWRSRKSVMFASGDRRGWYGSLISCMGLLGRWVGSADRWAAQRK